MIIKILGNKIKLRIVNGDANDLDLRYRGVSDHFQDKIVILQNKIPFNTLLHEIKHMYSSKIGVNQLEEYGKEVDCDMFSCCIEHLMLENGEDIFKKLKEFAEGEKK